MCKTYGGVKDEQGHRPSLEPRIQLMEGWSSRVIKHCALLRKIRNKDHHHPSLKRKKYRKQQTLKLQVLLQVKHKTQVGLPQHFCSGSISTVFSDGYVPVMKLMVELSQQLSSGSPQVTMVTRKL